MAMLVRERLNLPADERETLFLLSWTGRAEEGLKAELGEDGTMTERAALLCLVGLLSRLRYICEDVFKTEKNALIVEENPFMAIDPGLATAEMKAKASEKLLLELERTGGGRVFEKYPLLRGLLDSRTENYIQVCRELFERLRRDRSEICRRFFAGEDFGLVTEIKGDSGDLHFHGRSTCIIVTERGRFVYKPHDCGIDARFRELIGRGFSDMIRSPDCIGGEGYGWCEYVTPCEVGSKAGAVRFYRRFGGACALMQALGGSDLHSENWICSGEFPVLVDVETALSPVPRIYNDKSVFPELVTEEENFLYDVNHSLMPSSLLPARTGGREMSVLLDDSDYTSCEPVLSGKKLTVRGFEEEFLKGFSEGYDRCIEQSGELLRGLGSFSGVTVRKLMRNTDSYAKLLKKLYSAAALRSGDRRAAAVERLGDFFRLHGAEHMLPIARWEGECLLEGDIVRARRCCLTSRPIYRDHLCCGNSAALDFLLSLPDCREHAGRLLAFMKSRKDRGGRYHCLPENYRQVPCPDLFFGTAGIRFKIREDHVGATIIFVVDASGSMGAQKRMKAAKEAILSMLLDSYQKRDRIGLVAFRKDGAETLLDITASVDLAQKKLQTLPTGGRTPLAAGLFHSWQLLKARRIKDPELLPMLVLVTDGRANRPLWTEDAVKDAKRAAELIRRDHIHVVVIDTEKDFVSLHIARQLAEVMDAAYYKVDELQANQLRSIVKSRSPLACLDA